MPISRVWAVPVIALMLAMLLLASFVPSARASSSSATEAARSAVAPRAAGTGPVLLVGTAGLRWSDVSEKTTPHLWGLLAEGSQSAMTIRNVRRAACPVDGWLALSAGRRAGDIPATTPGRLCRVVPSPGSIGDNAFVPTWQGYVDYANSGDFDSRPGLFAEQLAAGGVSYSAIGPGAAIALASPDDGIVRGAYQSLPDDPAALTAAVQAETAAHDLVVVDVGAVRDPVDLADTDPDRYSVTRITQIDDLDKRIGAAVAGAKPGGTVIVASLADSGRTPHLQLLSFTGKTPPGTSPATYPTALLGSWSTRQDGLVQVTDLMPTVLELVGLTPPSDLPGATILPQPKTPTSTPDRRRALLDLDAAATHIQDMVPPFFNGLVIAQILLYGAGVVVLRKEWGGPEGRRRVLAVLRRVAIVFAAVPISTFLANLVPWWRTEHKLATIVAVVAVVVAVISVIALLGPWRDGRLGPLGFIGGITATVLALDVATGSRLQTSSLMGLQPLVGGRFYGLGNVQFALFASGSLMLACSLADAMLKRGRKAGAVATVVAVGVIAVVIDGTPGLGSDFGGPPAMIPAFLLMALLVAGVRITLRRVLLIGAVTVTVVTALCLVDWLRPPSQRTHLGRFVQTVIEGGAWNVILRKGLQNWEILTSSWLTLLVPFGAFFIALILMRPVAWGAPALQRTYEAAPTLKHGLIALCVMLSLGFALNDSGTVVPAIGAVLVIPLLIAASVRTLEMADADESNGEPGSLAGPPTEPAGSAVHQPPHPSGH